MIRYIGWVSENVCTAHCRHTWAFEESHLKEVGAERDTLEREQMELFGESITCSLEFIYYLIKLR